MNGSDNDDSVNPDIVELRQMFELMREYGVRRVTLGVGENRVDIRMADVLIQDDEIGGGPMGFRGAEVEEEEIDESPFARALGGKRTTFPGMSDPDDKES